MLVVVTVVLLLFKENYFNKNLKAPRPSEHPPVKNVNLSHIHVVTNRKIILARREVGNKCRLYKHFVVAAKK